MEMIDVLDTAFTRLVGCTIPLQQAGMGGAATPELAAAVSDAGGLGMVNLVMVPADDVAITVAALAERAGGPVGINFFDAFLGRCRGGSGGSSLSGCRVLLRRSAARAG